MSHRFTLLLLLSFTFCCATYAQDTKETTTDAPATKQKMPSLGCIDKALRVRAEDIKGSFTDIQGMTVLRDAMISMDPQVPFPIEIKFEKHHTYQLLFVNSKDASRAWLELYDGDDKLITKKIITKSDDPQYISYPFSPQETDTYLIVLTQQVKGNQPVCGSFTIMELPEGTETLPISDEHPPKK